MDEFGFCDGDILVFGNWIAIYSCCRETQRDRGETAHAIVFYSLMNLASNSYSLPWPNPRPGIGYIEDYTPRYATNEEIFRFFKRIDMATSARWDFKNKKYVFKSENAEEYSKL